MFNLFKKKMKPKNAYEQFVIALYGNPPPPADRANLEEAVGLAHGDLLGGVIDLEDVRKHAISLNDGIMPHTTHDLALSTALYFYREIKYVSALSEVQLVARMNLLEWLTKKLVHPMLVESFEDDLYKLYKPTA